MSLTLHHVTRRYGAVTALREVSCEIPAVQLVGLLGPNGAGKSTLLRIAATLLAPSAGEVWVNGHDLRQAAPAIRRDLGYLPEAPPFDPVLSVTEYLRFRAKLKQIPRREQAGRVDRQIELWQLQGVRRQRVDRLSLGYRRRVGLADALLGNPRVLLLDEPTIGLDPLQVVETRQLLRRLAGEVTVIVSTHLLAEVELLCDRALVLRRGELVADLALGATATGPQAFDLELSDPPEQVRALLEQWGRLVILPTRAGGRWRIETALSAPELARGCVTAGFQLCSLRACQPTLEDRLLAIEWNTLREAA
ncbi:MAG: ABC transporter ATP-binding protein [Planctomycetaceae bacterium]